MNFVTFLLSSHSFFTASITEEFRQMFMEGTSELRQQIAILSSKVPNICSFVDLTPSCASTSRRKDITSLLETLGLRDRPLVNPGAPYSSQHAPRKFNFVWGKKDESQGYEPLKEHLMSNGFKNIFCVDSGNQLVFRELFDVNVYELRSKVGAHGEPLVAKVRLHGRTDLVALCDENPEGSHIFRHMVTFGMEVKRTKDMSTKEFNCNLEGMMQVIGLCVDNSRCAPPVILTDLCKKHCVLYLVRARTEPLEFSIQKQICSSVLCAAEFALKLATADERRGIARDFGRGPTPLVSPAQSLHAKDDDSQDSAGNPEPELIIIICIIITHKQNYIMEFINNLRNMFPIYLVS